MIKQMTYGMVLGMSKARFLLLLPIAVIPLFSFLPAWAADDAIIITRSDVLQYESINPSAYLKDVVIHTPRLPHPPATMADNPVWPSDIHISQGRISNGYQPVLSFSASPTDADSIETMVGPDGSDHFTPLETPFKYRKTDTN